ncbi:FkbM family methyltransferase [Desulfosudis oleivorans]|uniref:Methyltransferase FkbM family n=1 Tax=Desulfosudis oleivorans (strain DSM 6200 / JCM 39069 / Hxd3) TaxID=96561 RepID=A8ZU25_DESOH|nr:FkbM family methyltransferase [Desulfosudis oleivorans]ABW66337.1 methyltransferase FkbM family [Desulfosudis oleivorans Hxd3]
MNSIILRTVNMVNRILKPVGAKIISRQADDFNINSAIERIHDHGIRIDSVVDIGGSNGTWSLKAMKVFPAASFVAIEPLVERKEELLRLVRRFPKFSFELCAAGETDGDTATLTIAQDLDGSTINGHGGETRRVPVRTIDAIVAKHNLSGSFLLKFDTHGYELPILKGAKQTLEKTSVIIMEVYNFQISQNALRFHKMCAHMENLGFRCYDMADPMLRDHDKALWQMDLFFCRKDEKIFDHPHYK